MSRAARTRQIRCDNYPTAPGAGIATPLRCDRWSARALHPPNNSKDGVSLVDWFSPTVLDAGAGCVTAAIVSGAAYRLRALTFSGVLAATAVGGLIVATAGWWAGLVLIAFFATSSALSHFSSGRTIAEEQARGRQRDAVQVLANGGIPALCAGASAVAENDGPWLAALAAAVAGAAADTWATEIGRHSPSRPRLVTSWRKAEPGTSGAVSAIGSVGSLAGALVIAIVAAGGTALGWFDTGLSTAGLIVAVALAGVAGSIVDSLLGATLQAGFVCPACNRPTERAIHICGAVSRQVRGARWMTNDSVNLLAIAAAAAVGFALSQ